MLSHGMSEVYSFLFKNILRHNLPPKYLCEFELLVLVDSFY